MEVIWLLLFFVALAVIAAEAILFAYGLFAILGLALAGFALMSLQAAGEVFGMMVTDNVVYTLVAIGGLILGAFVWFAAKSYSHKAEPLLVGESVTVLSWGHGKGRVRALGGEVWTAISHEGLEAGDIARVTSIDRLSLTVVKEQ